MLCDYELEQGSISLFVDNKSAIELSKNLVQHYRAKHINITPFHPPIGRRKCLILGLCQDQRSISRYSNQTS